MNKQTKLLSASQKKIMLIVLCLCYMIPNYAQYQMSPLGARVIEQYDLQLSQLSSLFSAPMIPAIFFSLAGGLLLDRFGAKSVVGVALLLTSLGCVGRVLCGTYTPLFLSTMLIGFTACFINVGSGKIVGGLVEAKDVAAKMGILTACSTAVKSVASFTSAYFPTIQSAFIVAAVFSVVGLVLWLVFAKDTKQKEPSESTPSLTIGECLKVTTRNKSIWLIAFALFFLMAANIVVGSFLPTALISRGMSAAISGVIAAFYTVGNFLGCFVAPMCISKLHSEKKVLIIFAILAGVGVAFSWLIGSTIFLAIAFLLTGTFLGGMIPPLMSIPVRLPEIGPTYAGTAGGVIGTIQVIGAVVIPSYVVAPIAGDSFLKMFILGGVCVLIAGALCSFLKKI